MLPFLFWKFVGVDGCIGGEEGVLGKVGNWMDCLCVF